jgi:uncharacterized membrane protein YfcA
VDFDYQVWQIAAILSAYLFAAAVKGITGLGFSTTCLPILAFAVGLKNALPLVIIPSLASNLMVMYSAGRFRETIFRFWPMLAATVPGLILGLWALSIVSGVQAGASLGVILVLWCVFSLASPELVLPKHLERTLSPVSGGLTGFINGLTGSQVFPLVPYLMMLKLERDLFIQGINCSFTLHPRSTHFVGPGDRGDLLRFETGGKSSPAVVT